MSVMKEPTTAFCPGCGGPLALVWKRGKCTEGTCIASGGKLASPARFGLALAARRKTNGLLSDVADYWCGGCGKKLKARPSKTPMYGAFSISRNCVCGSVRSGTCHATPRSGSA